MDIIKNLSIKFKQLLEEELPGFQLYSLTEGTEPDSFHSEELPVVFVVLLNPGKNYYSWCFTLEDAQREDIGDLFKYVIRYEIKKSL